MAAGHERQTDRNTKKRGRKIQRQREPETARDGEQQETFRSLVLGVTSHSLSHLLSAREESLGPGHT